jgi:hypothetical protein
MNGSGWVCLNGALWDTRRPPSCTVALPSMGALVGGPSSFPVNELWVNGSRKALGRGISFHGGPIWGTRYGALFLGRSEISKVKVCFGYGASLSMGALRGEPGRGDPLLGFINDMCRRPGGWASLSVGPRGELGGRFLYWEFWEVRTVGSDDEHLPPLGPWWGTWKGVALSPGTARDR